MDNATLESLAADYGTPLYIFDYDALQTRVDLLKSIFPKRVELCFAMKANPFLLPALNGQVPFEVCSPGEYRICQACDVEPQSVVLSGVYKDPAFIHELVSSHTPMRVYTIESLTQIDLLLAEAKEAGDCLPVIPRISHNSQFGIEPNLVEQLIAEHKDSPYLDIRGIQYFTGTQHTSLKKVKRELSFIDTFVQKLEEGCGFTPSYVEYGPGLPAEYFDDDVAKVQAEDLAHLQGFAQLLDDMAYQGPLVFEVGRGIAASCGTYLTKIVDMKCNGGVNYALVDGGMNHLVYYGHSMAMRQPVCDVLPLRDNADAPDWAICGALCSTNDILSKQMPIANAQLGDILAFRNTGAYCMTEGISLFLSRDLPKVIAVGAAAQGVRVLRDQQPSFIMNTPQ